MPTYRIAQRIHAPAETVWHHLSGVLAWPQWLPTVTDVAPLDGGTLQVGARFKVVQPKLRPVVWQVTRVEPGQCFTWESVTPGVRLWAHHTVRSLAPRESEVELQFRFSGVLGIPIGWLAGKITRKYISTEAASLKALAESRAGSEA